MKKTYQGTKVSWAKTQTQIVKLLNERDIYESRFTNLEDKFVLEFRVKESKKVFLGIGINKGITVRVVVPFHLGNNPSQRGREIELNRLHRVLLNHIKAKFVAIENGVTEFMEEFMPHLVIMDKTGNSTTMGQTLLPQYKKSIESGEQKPFNLLGDGN